MASLVPREADKCIILVGLFATWMKVEVSYNERKSKWIWGQPLEIYTTPF